MLKLGADFRGRFSSSSYCLVEECFKNKLNVQHSVVDSLKKMIIIILVEEIKCIQRDSMPFPFSV